MESVGDRSVSLAQRDSSRCPSPVKTVDDARTDRNPETGQIGASQSGSVCSVFSLQSGETDVEGSTSNSNSCRICRDNTVDNDIVSPCNCSGTLGRVHVHCLEEWLSASNKNACEICNYEFRVMRTPKNFREWLQNPRSRTERRYLVGDCTCFVVLTPLVIIATWLCSQGALYYFTFGHSWTAAGLMLLCSFLWFVFFFWLTITFRFHRKTWINWRRMNQTVKLLIERQTGMEDGGPGMVDGGLGFEEYGPGIKDYGPGLEDGGPRMKDYVPRMEAHRSRREDYGPGKEINGAEIKEYGSRKEDYGPRREDYGSRKEDYGPRREDYGPRRDDYGPGKEINGAEIKEYGPRREDYGPRREVYGPGKEDYGPRKEEYGPIREDYGTGMQDDGLENESVITETFV